MSIDLRRLGEALGASRRVRGRMSLGGEFLLALAPTVTVVAVLALVDAVGEQKLLFASLASSAFLIYLDPQHEMNRVRTLIVGQLIAAGLGWIAFATLGTGFLSGGVAMVATITAMILLDAVHPPAIGTAMSFALRAGTITNVMIFALAVGITVVLVLLEHVVLWAVERGKGSV